MCSLQTILNIHKFLSSIDGKMCLFTAGETDRLLLRESRRDFYISRLSPLQAIQLVCHVGGRTQY